MNARPMTVSARAGGPGVVLVDVTHEDWQSYSRAVTPRAMRYARTDLPPGQWALVEVDTSAPVVDRRTITTYTFEKRK